MSNNKKILLLILFYFTNKYAQCPPNLLSPIGTFPTGIAGQPFVPVYSPNGQFLATANIALNNVVMYRVDFATGVLTQIGTFNVASGVPLGVSFSPDGRFLLVTSLSGFLTVFQVDQITGQLTQVGSPVATGGINSPFAMFSPNGQLVAVSNQVSNNVSLFAFDLQTGTLTPLVLGFTDASFNQPAVSSFFSDGRFFTVSNNGGSSISILEVINNTISVVNVVPSGANPTVVRFKNVNGTLFAGVGSSMSPAGISMYTVIPNSPIFIPVPGSPFESGTLFFDIAFSADNKFVYASNSANSLINLFSLASNGALTLICTVPTNGLNPVFLGLSPDGRFLAVVNGDSSTITVFRTNIVLTPIILVPRNNCILLNNTPIISGFAEPNSIISIFLNGILFGTTTSNNLGSWNFQINSPLTDGAYTITAQATNFLGNISAISNPVAIAIRINTSNLTKAIAQKYCCTSLT